MLVYKWLLTHPLDSSQTVTVAVARLPSLRARERGKDLGHWFARLRPAVKISHTEVYEKVIKLSQEVGWLRGFFLEKIKVAIPETLCKTMIGFSPEYLCDIPNVATTNETRNDDGCFTEAPVSAKQAGVLHIEKQCN